jgi:hypothetical protein
MTGGGEYYSFMRPSRFIQELMRGLYEQFDAVFGDENGI